MTLHDFPRISIDATICGGPPVITGTRMRVSHILDLLAEGANQDAIVAGHPNLAVDDVRAALRCAARMKSHPVVMAA